MLKQLISIIRLEEIVMTVAVQAYIFLVLQISTHSTSLLNVVN